MSDISEQLWFTWSTWGFSGINGFQIRAVSRGLKTARGSIDVQSELFQVLMKHLGYVLPQDVDDPYEVSPQEAPLCLTFVKAGQQAILVNKTYTGLDGVKRPGAF